MPLMIEKQITKQKNETNKHLSAVSNLHSIRPGTGAKLVLQFHVIFLPVIKIILFLTLLKESFKNHSYNVTCHFTLKYIKASDHAHLYPAQYVQICTSPEAICTTTNTNIPTFDRPRPTAAATI
uniref:(northern house mosquito) hypothetical protein n=1 Tax=Culex pipiens TaxID=7175 RepID=A0A8D8BRK2_CULPI